jgi:hypothetical protein
MRYLHPIGVAALCIASPLLASCGGLQSSAGFIGTGVAPELKTARASLLYLSNVRNNDVEVYSYPAGRMVGKLSSFGKPRGECADAQGNVWIVDTQAFQVEEYPHGSTQPIVALSTPGAPNGCSVSPHGNDLAVAGAFQGGAALAVYHRSTRKIWRDPRIYVDASMRVGEFCGYDAKGNLFVDGLSSAHHGKFALVELTLGAKALTGIAVSQQVTMPGQVQWDGRYVAIGDSGLSPSVVYQFSISGSAASLAGTTTLDKSKRVVQFWIDGARIIGPDFGSRVGFWSYPRGGSPTKTIAVPGYGAAVSR